MKKIREAVAFINRFVEAMAEGRFKKKRVLMFLDCIAQRKALSVKMLNDIQNRKVRVHLDKNFLPEQ